MLYNIIKKFKNFGWFVALAIVFFFIYISKRSKYVEDDLEIPQKNAFSYIKLRTSKINNYDISETKKTYYENLKYEFHYAYLQICRRYEYFTEGEKNILLSLLCDDNFEDIEIGEKESFKIIICEIDLESMFPLLFSNDVIYNAFRGKKKIKPFPKPFFEDIKRKRVVELLTLEEPFDFQNYKKMSFQDRNSKFSHIKTELEGILNQVELPKEINSVLNDSDNFICCLEMLEPDNYVINRNTIELMKLKCHNKFIKHIINNIIIVELDSVEYKLCQFSYLKEELKYNIYFFTDDLITDPVILNLNSVSFSKLFYINETSPDKKFNDYDMIIYENVKISIDFLFLSCIVDYLELYVGIKIPEIMIDSLSTRIIRNPVMLVNGEYYFVDLETVVKNRNQFLYKSPYTSSPLSEAFLEKYIWNYETDESETYSTENPNYENYDISDEIDPMKHDENILETMIDEFISLFPFRFRKFLENYRKIKEVLHA